MQQYLASTEFINWQHPSVLAKAISLAASKASTTEIAKACFQFVRDDIEHCWDYKRDILTCSASEVLEHKTGYCYAKSHLLAALLRANNIPAGLCYQRLTIKNDQPPFCIHGLNAVYLPDIGWYRLDPRGNRHDVDAQFIPPKEQLAFPIIINGEMDFPSIYATPLPAIIKLLTQHPNVAATADQLPDFASLPDESDNLAQISVVDR